MEKEKEENSVIKTEILVEGKRKISKEKNTGKRASAIEDMAQEEEGRNRRRETQR